MPKNRAACFFDSSCTHYTNTTAWDNVYSAVITKMSLQEFTRFI